MIPTYFLSTSLIAHELPSIIIASPSIYLSYEAGMVMNDCAAAEESCITFALLGGGANECGDERPVMIHYMPLV